MMNITYGAKDDEDYEIMQHLLQQDLSTQSEIVVNNMWGLTYIIDNFINIIAPHIGLFQKHQGNQFCVLFFGRVPDILGLFWTIISLIFQNAILFNTLRRHELPPFTATFKVS